MSFISTFKNSHGLVRRSSALTAKITALRVVDKIQPEISAATPA